MSVNQTVRTIDTETATIQYQLHIKNVKNLNLRIRADGSVYVSANRFISVEKINEFVLAKSDYILAAIDKFKSREKLQPLQKQYVSGETFLILGRGLRLKVSEGQKETIKSDGVYLFLSVKDTNEFSKKQKLVTHYIDEQCRCVFAEIINEIYPMFKKYGVNEPVLRIRDMKTRWGSCIPTKGIITLNKKLLSAPRNCIEYVVLHECCHFIHPNHSKAFYSFVTMLMPDWKERKKYLDIKFII